jgi:hypothetical protein
VGSVLNPFSATSITSILVGFRLSLTDYHLINNMRSQIGPTRFEKIMKASSFRMETGILDAA